MTRRGFLAGAALGGLARRARAESRYPPIGDFIAVDGVALHYVDVGAGPPVVLIHGASGNLRDFTFSLTGRLAAAGYRAVAFDRPGLGHSQRAPARGWNPAVQAALMRRAARALVMDPPVVVGHSWGGAAAMAWAVDAPDFCRGVLSLAGATHPWGTGVGPFYQLGASEVFGGLARGAASLLVNRDDPGAVLSRIFRPNVVPAGYARYIGVDLALREPQFRHNAEDLVNLDATLRNQAPRYRGLAVPVEAIHGEADRTVLASVHAQRLVAEVRNGRLTMLKKTGHMPHHAEEATVMAAIARLADGAP